MPDYSPLRKFVLNIIEVDSFPDSLPEAGDAEMNYAYLEYPSLDLLAVSLARRLGAEVYTEDGIISPDLQYIPRGLPLAEQAFQETRTNGAQ